MKIVFELVFNPSSFIIAAGLTANGLTPMKNGLLMALQEIVKNGKLFFFRFFLEVYVFLRHKKFQSQPVKLRPGPRNQYFRQST